MDPHDIDRRLTDLEASLPITSAPPALPSAPTRRRGLVTLAAGGLMVLVLTGTAVAGAVVAGLKADQAPGVENPGQPLAGAQLECMSPPDAARYLARHGFKHVVWQVEFGWCRQGRRLLTPTVDGARARVRHPGIDPGRRQAVHGRRSACERDGRRGMQRDAHAMTANAIEGARTRIPATDGIPRCDGRS